MHVNLNYLATLECVVRHGTLVSAAAELGYTPGALSQQMEALSRSLGAAVFVRSGRLLELTDAGRSALRHVPELLEVENHLLRDVSASESEVSDTLVLGIWGSTAASLIAPVLDNAMTRHPGLVVASREVDVDDATGAVRRRHVDAAFGLVYPDLPIKLEAGVTVLKLREERFGIAVAQADTVRPGMQRLRDLADDDWVLPSASTQYGLAIRNACRRHGFEPRVRHELIDTAATLTLASRGLGIAPVTELMLKLSPIEGVRRIELADDVLRELVLVVPTISDHRASVAALVAVIVETISNEFTRH